MAKEGRKVGGSTKIPVKEMALTMLPQMFPHLNEAQLDSLRNGTPMPSTLAQVQPDDMTPDRREAIRRDNFDANLLRQIVSRMQDSPTVSCLLVFSRPEAGAAKMARKAVNQFVAQSYPNKQLVIVNGTDTRITNVPHREIREVQVRDCHTVADLRNRGLELADGDWVKPCWDDDDGYDPHLLTFQMMHRQPGKAIMLTHQLRVAIWNGTTFVHEDRNGIANTIIAPRSLSGRFPAFSDVEQEDLLWANENYGVKRVAVENRDFPSNSLSIAVYHDRNKSSYEQFMGQFAAPDLQGRWAVGQDEARHIKAVLATFGLEATTRVSKDKGPLAEANA